MRDEIQALWAEFGVWGGEFPYIDPMTQNTEIGSEFRGGYFDLDQQGEEKGWSDVEKEIVARHMLTLLEKRPGWAQFSLHSKAPAPKPWPTYDETHHNQIPTMAQAIGMLAEALSFEVENKNRDSVVEKLKELLRAQQEAAATEESLTAA